MKVKKEFLLEGLDCANCANKIEAKVQVLEGVSAASMNFVTKTLKIELEASLSDSISSAVLSIIKKLEPDVIVHEKFEKKHEETSEDEENNSREWLKLALGSILFASALLLKLSFWAEFSIYLAAYLIVGSNVLIRSLKNISQGQIFDENLLMSIATIGAFAIGQFPEGVAVMLFYLIGELFQDMAVGHSRRSIRALLDIRPDYANLKDGLETKKVSPESVNIGDFIVIKPGERIPLDGKITSGTSFVDTSSLTGESVPRQVSTHDDVLAGFINTSGLLTLQVTKPFSESTVNKILELVENASSKKAPTEKFITKFAKYYTPVVVFSALALALLPPLIIPGATFSEWIYRALIFLVISCPCALVISIPLGFFGGIGAASKHGILVKGSNYLEALNNVSTVVFDKTGTLTKGVFKVTDVVPTEAGEDSRHTLLTYAALAESYSNHPIALSILNAWCDAHDCTYGEEINRDDVIDYSELSGLGLQINTVHGKIWVGNARLMAQEGIKVPDLDTMGTIVHVAVDTKYAGYIVISDEIKEDAALAIRQLKLQGVKTTVMLTGDSSSTAEKVAGLLQLDQFYAQLLPHQKVEWLEKLEQEKPAKSNIIFVGDGINDAPVLARADIGIAMGGLGSDAAIEAADIVIMTDEPSKIAEAIEIAKRTRLIVWQNIFFAMAVKGVVLLLGAGGLATMWEAVFADVGVALLAVLNAMRVRRS